ncbi:hypothetical protein [Massilia orientalis]|uniref:Uncharacterized protein n=1 Tax=Massilia orientalis TaxID=3050128 RepID=A0ACC7MDJ9_9BURK|nr:hypothetical protein [Massilia sp. YIM B02787]
MSAQLSRLQAFLAGAGELEVVAPAPAIRPDYFGRFAKLMGATVVVAHVASAAAAGPAPQPAPAAAAAPATAAAPTARDRASTQASIISVKKIAARYLSDGHSPLKPVITMMNPEEEPDVGPTASALPGDKCVIEGVRTDYGKTKHLATMAGTPEQRAQVLVHESMHCRLGPALLRYVAHNPSAASFAVTFSESSADAMAILTTARKDGVPAALAALDHWYKIRETEAASPDSDGLHDSRETLNRIRELLTTAPERIDSDGVAFALAITEGLAGASKTYAAALPSERKDYIASTEFQAHMAGFHQAVEEMAHGYLEGPYQLGAPEITLNDQTLSSGAPPVPSAWQLLAMKLGGQPFTAADLRRQVEAITGSFINAAGGSTSQMLTATAPAPAAAPATLVGAAGAIARLKSHLNSIYVDPVPVVETQVPDLDNRSAIEPGQPAM